MLRVQMRLFAAFCSIAMCVAAVPRASAGDKAFDVDKKVFFSKVHHVVIWPCKFPPTFSRSDTLLARSDAAKWQLDSLLAIRFAAAGIRFVSGREADSIHAQVVDSLGGLYDEATGAVDTTRFEIAISRTRGILRDRYHPDAWVWPLVYHTSARFAYGTASWDGVKEEITVKGTGGGLLRRLSKTSDSDYEGHIQALSLGVLIKDDAEKTLYLNSGGLQTVARFSNHKFVDLPQSAYFSDESRLSLAVGAAFKPFDKAAKDYDEHEK